MAIPSGSFINDLISQQETLLALNNTYIAVIAADSAQLLSVLAQPKPDYNIDGQSVSWAGYTAMLQRSIQEMQESIKLNMETLETLNTLIMQNQPYQYWSRVTGGYGNYFV